MKKYVTRIFFGASLLAMFLPLYSLLCWILVFYTTVGGQMARRERFYTFFPSFLTNGIQLTIIAIACCILAVIFSLVVLSMRNRRLENMSVGILLTALLLMCWFIFTLM